jgi:hypothetical protein
MAEVRRVETGADAETVTGRPLVAAPVGDAPVAVGAPKAAMGPAGMDHRPAHGPEPRYDDPGTAPTVGVELTQEPHQFSGPPPVPPAPPPYGPSGPDPGARPRSRRTLVVLLAVVALVR